MTDDLVKSYNTIVKNVVEKDDQYSFDLTNEYKVEYMDFVKELSKELQDTADELSELRTLESQIINNRRLSGDEKRDQLTEISRLRNELLKVERIPERRKVFIEEILPRAVQR
jgi:predicted metal-binding transcription factor (methanogenesis marker protein 9)